MKTKSTGLSDRVSDVILVAICVVILVIIAYPLYYLLIASISDPYDVINGKTFLLPSQVTIDGYISVFQSDELFTGFKNSVMYTIIGTLFSVTIWRVTNSPFLWVHP